MLSRPCPPEIRRPPDIVFIAVVDTLPMARLVELVKVFCFVLKVLTILVPETVNAPLIDVFPVTFRVELSTAAPSHCNSREATTSRPRTSPLVVTLATDSAEVELTTALALAAMRVSMSTLLT